MYRRPEPAVSTVGCIFYHQNQTIMHHSIHEGARYMIDGHFYKLSDTPPEKGDLVIDVRDGLYGYHDGVCAGRILVRDGGLGTISVVEGCLPEHVRKLIPALDIPLAETHN